MVSEYASAKISNHERQALLKGYGGFPSKHLLGLGDVWLSLVGVVRSVWPELNSSIGIDRLLYKLQQTNSFPTTVVVKHCQWLTLSLDARGTCAVIFYSSTWSHFCKSNNSKHHIHTLASSSMVNSPGLPRLKGPICSPSINRMSPST